MDRVLGRAARAIGMDPAALRRRNLVRPDAMPYRTGLTYRDGVAIVYDPADYPAAFDRVLERLDYDRWRKQQQERRGSSRPIGLGLSAYVEGTGIGPFEGADVRVDTDGTVKLLIGVASQGQSHETTLAQICAAELGGPPERVIVMGGDTSVIGVLRYAAVHDCGRPINPMVVEGQLHGGVVQGIGAALSEALVFDANGQLLTASLMDYGVPRADQIPPLDVIALDHASMVNELGIKGVGESGIISPPAVIANAVEDALADYGIDIRTLPLTPARVWDALRQGGRPC